MLRPNKRGDAGENRHNSIIKNPLAFTLRGLLRTSSDAFLKAHLGRQATQSQPSFPYSALGSALQRPKLAPKTLVAVGLKLLGRSYPSSIQKKFPFLTSDLDSHSITKSLKKQTHSLTKTQKV